MRRLLGRNAEVACAFIAYLVRRNAQIQEDLANNLLSSSEQRLARDPHLLNCSSSSLPSARVRHGPEDSLNASPNLACGTVFTTASYMSSAVLMKCVWPTMMLVSSGNLHPDRFKLEHKVLQRCEMRSHHSAGTAGLRGQLQMACALALCLTQSVTRAHTCSILGNHDLLRHSWPERNVMKD